MSGMKRLIARCGALSPRRWIDGRIRTFVLDWPLNFGIETAAMNDVKGDYLEFGVFRGRSFILSYKNAERCYAREDFERMSFIAFDSFEGLPDTRDARSPGRFVRGAYRSSMGEFVRNLRKAGVDLKKVDIVPGFYAQSLSDPQLVSRFKQRKAACVYVDCDIYESAVPVFEFLTDKLQPGTVLVIDDWYRHKGSAQHGIQRAFHEWIEEHPDMSYIQLASSKRLALIMQ